jgi:hypothetical protein
MIPKDEARGLIPGSACGRPGMTLRRNLPQWGGNSQGFPRFRSFLRAEPKFLARGRGLRQNDLSGGGKRAAALIAAKRGPLRLRGFPA